MLLSVRVYKKAKKISFVVVKNSCLAVFWAMFIAIMYINMLYGVASNEKTKNRW